MVKQVVKKFFGVLGINIGRMPDKVPSNFSAPSLFDYEDYLWLRSYDFKTIIDVGANEGQFATKILHVFPDAHVYCFEPLKDVYDKLKSNFAQHTNVTTYNLGLGEKDEEKTINHNEYSPSSSLLEMHDLHKDNFDFAIDTSVRQISVRTLDGILHPVAKRPLLLKIDVQGYEMYVIKGGEKVIDNADVVIVETSFYPLYKGQALFEEIYNYFINKGFKYAGNIDQLTSPVDKKILQADSVFLR